jgi:ankyrin repeat protein
MFLLMIMLSIVSCNSKDDNLLPHCYFDEYNSDPIKNISVYLPDFFLPEFRNYSLSYISISKLTAIVMNSNNMSYKTVDYLIRTLSLTLNDRNIYGKTVLYFACEYSSYIKPEIIKLLLEYGSDQSILPNPKYHEHIYHVSNDAARELLYFDLLKKYNNAYYAGFITFISTFLLIFYVLIKIIRDDI